MSLEEIEEAKIERHIKFLKHAIGARPESWLRDFEQLINHGRNRVCLDRLGIRTIDDLKYYIDSQEA